MLTTEMQSAEALWLEIKTYLEEKKNLLNEEIINYPPPIPACDAQFNYLLEERARLTAELNRLQELAGQGADDADTTRLLQEFITSCAHIDTDSEVAWNIRFHIAV
ncbi:MAG: hypothetical protein KJ069_27085 [Anaerolineae bacterium]|nr:hypothetical protein [Anaerolineae bacterium]